MVFDRPRGGVETATALEPSLQARLAQTFTTILASHRPGGGSLTLFSRRVPLSLALAGAALLAALLVIPWAVQAQSDPAAPGNLTAEVLDDGISLSWDAPPEQAGAVTGYQVLRRRPVQGENSLLTLVDDTGSSATGYTDGTAAEAGVALRLPGEGAPGVGTERSIQLRQRAAAGGGPSPGFHAGAYAGHSGQAHRPRSGILRPRQRDAGLGRPRGRFDPALRGPAPASGRSSDIRDHRRPARPGPDRIPGRRAGGGDGIHVPGPRGVGEGAEPGLGGRRCGDPGRSVAARPGPAHGPFRRVRYPRQRDAGLGRPGGRQHHRLPDPQTRPRREEVRG